MGELRYGRTTSRQGHGGTHGYGGRGDVLRSGDDRGAVRRVPGSVSAGGQGSGPSGLTSSRSAGHPPAPVTVTRRRSSPYAGGMGGPPAGTTLHGPSTPYATQFLAVARSGPQTAYDRGGAVQGRPRRGWRQRTGSQLS
ncbi:hypothetical protein GCM10010393_29340 [Streptomyces gobitricini]|uniref:Uncharacterized protein n=1 Tax=Streptomyces gobitricini TaxID=68211 RepID=A0ABN3M470_9ACTN